MNIKNEEDGLYKNEDAVKKDLLSINDLPEVKSKVVSICYNTPEKIKAIPKGVIANIPIVLTNIEVKFLVKDIIMLPEKVCQIKKIKNKLRLNKCILSEKTGTLFLKGYVCKSIDYFSSDYLLITLEENNLKTFITDIPFEFVMNISENILRPIKRSKSTSENLPFCQLISCFIAESAKFIVLDEQSSETKRLKKDMAAIDDKMFIKLKLSILKRHQVYISTYDVYKNLISSD